MVSAAVILFQIGELESRGCTIIKLPHLYNNHLVFIENKQVLIGAKLVKVEFLLQMAGKFGVSSCPFSGFFVEWEGESGPSRPLATVLDEYQWGVPKYTNGILFSWGRRYRVYSYR